MKIHVDRARPEIVVISDGKIFEKNLKCTGNNLQWLKTRLKQQGKQQNEVFLAVCRNKNELKIYDVSDKQDINDPFE